MIPSKYLVMLLEAINTKYDIQKVRISAYKLSSSEIVLMDIDNNEYTFKQSEICCVNLEKLDRIIENK